MFKKHSVQMKLVKDVAPEPTKTLDPETVETIALQAILAGRQVVRGTAVLLSTYIAADTVRKIAMHIVATKIQ